MFNRNNNGPREMVQGNWICGQDDSDGRGCGKVINELPFMPTAGRAVFCRDCNTKNRESRDTSRSSSMVSGNWICGQDDPDNKGCGRAITELPFAPTSGRPIYCKDCWSKNRPPKRF